MRNRCYLFNKIICIYLDGLNDIPEGVNVIVNRLEMPGFSGWGEVFGEREWAPGAYIPSGIPSDIELKKSIDELLRRLVSFYVWYAVEIVTLRYEIKKGNLTPQNYRSMISKKRLKHASDLPTNWGTIGEIFDIYYGQKELHSRENIVPGISLIISPTEQYNGCYDWLAFEDLLCPPFITVAQTGSIGEAFVQLEPCGVNNDCLVLLPKIEKNISIAKLLIAAAVIRLEKWRFNYGRKLTPARICNFPIPSNPNLENWVEKKLKK